MNGSSLSLKTSELSAGYNRRKVFEKLNLECHSGRMIGVIGPNGAGKSTLLRCISGLLSPLSGTVYLNGKELHKMHRLELARRMSTVLTDRRVDGLLTVFEVVAMGRYPYTDALGRLKSSDVEAVWEALKLAGVSHLAYRYFNELSDGERQKVMLARALAQNPNVIILDEPTSFLDLKNRIEILQIIRSLTKLRSITAIISTHEVDLAIKLCDIIVLMARDGCVRVYSPEELIEEDVICEVYGVDNQGFDRLLLTLEPILPRDRPINVHVISGGATGVPIFRILAKHDMAFSTGVLHENDADYHIARAMGAKVISEKAFMPIGDQAIEETLKMIRGAFLIVDTGFPVGEINEANLHLVNQAVKLGKKVISLRNCQAIQLGSSNILYIRSLRQFSMFLKEMLLKAN